MASTASFTNDLFMAKKSQSPIPSIANLPVTLPPQLLPPPTQHITAEDPTSVHDNYDAEQLLHAANMLNLAWSHVYTIDSITKLIKATISLSQHRRRCFQKPYGAPHPTIHKPDIVLPID